MKLSFIILILSINVVLASHSYAQKALLSLSISNKSVSDVLDEIENQSEFRFYYNSKLVDTKRKVSVNTKDEDVFSVLNQLFASTDVGYKVVDKDVILVERDISISSPQITVFQQGIAVSGIVSDSDGLPVPGVNIIIKGIRGGAVSDINGKYSVTVADKSAVLIFSFVGYVTSEFLVGDQRNIDVVLYEDTREIEEIVVVGYGVQKRVNLTGSVATISSKDIAQTPSSNLTNMVAGRLPGVIATNKNGQPGSGSDLQIRGTSTLNDNKPLVVIDGFVRDDFANIDPHEIESISILKDASASAVYGARAANGVFLITTKRGQMGKPKFSYSGMFGLQSPTQYPELLNAYEWASIRNQAMANQGYDRDNPAHASNFIPDEKLAEYKAGRGTDWYDETFKKNSFVTQHNFSVNGGTEAIRYFMSLGYLDQDGMYDNFGFKRYNFRTNVDTKITRTLTVSMNIEGRQENTNAPGWDAGSIFAYVIRQNPTYESYYPSGRPVNTNGEHPIEMIRSSGYNNNRNNTFHGALSLEQKLSFITEGLAVKGSAAIYKQAYFKKYFFTPYSMYDEDADGNITGVKKVGGETALEEEFKDLHNLTTQLSLNYGRTFGKHDIAALALFEQYAEKGDKITGRKQDFKSNIKDELDASGTNNQKLSGSGILNDARRAVVGRVNYAYAGKYLLEASFRYDGSYRFAKGNRYGFFPSVSAGWRISEEGFFRNVSALNFIHNLKIRVSKGMIGNDRVDAFQYTDLYAISGSGGVSDNQIQATAKYGVYPNPDITWEKQDNNNLGIEAGFWKGKLNMEFDLFYRKTKDILWKRERSVPETFGRKLSNENYAQVRSNGFELTLAHQNNIGDWRYNVRLIGSYANNKVTRIDDPTAALDYEKQLNRPIGFKAGYDALGIFQSDEEAANWYGGKQFGSVARAGDIKYANLDDDNEITSKDQKILSNNGYTPKIVYGLSAGVQWKGFDLDFLIQGAGARTVEISGTGRTMYRGGGTSNTFAYLTDSWSTDNRDAKYPLAWIDSRAMNDQTSSVWLKKAAYLRLKAVNIGYTFKQPWFKQIGIDHLRIYVSGLNLLTWSQLKEFDPEMESGGGNYYPQQKNMNVGINLTF